MAFMAATAMSACNSAFGIAAAGFFYDFQQLPFRFGFCYLFK
jgi:hypothetical protein